MRQVSSCSRRVCAPHLVQPSPCWHWVLEQTLCGQEVSTRRNKERQEVSLSCLHARTVQLSKECTSCNVAYQEVNDGHSFVRLHEVLEIVNSPCEPGVCVWACGVCVWCPHTMRVYVSHLYSASLLRVVAFLSVGLVCSCVCMRGTLYIKQVHLTK